MQLALKTLLGHYSSQYSLWNLKRLSGQLIWGIRYLDRTALSALAYSVDVGQTIEDSLVSVVVVVVVVVVVIIIIIIIVV